MSNDYYRCNRCRTVITKEQVATHVCERVTDLCIYVKCFRCGEYVNELEWDAHVCDTSTPRAYRFPLTRVIEANMVPHRKYYYIKDTVNYNQEPVTLEMAVCVVKDDTGMLQQKTVYTRGIAYLAIGDTVNRPLARTICRGRALKAIETKEHRVARVKDMRMLPLYLHLAKEHKLPTILDVPVHGIEDEDGNLRNNVKPPVLFTARYDAELTPFERHLWAEKCPKCGEWVFGTCTCS